VPRTANPKKRSVRFCGDCGYELARDNDGACPMCARFEQLRIDFTVPRPSDLAAHRAGTLDTNVPVVADDRPPTVREYRSILAERRLGSASTAESAATVIRTPGLRRTMIPSPPTGATAPGDGALAPPAEPKPPAKNLASPSPKKTRARRGQGESRRAARARVRSARAAEGTDGPAPASAWIPPESADVPATPSPGAPPKAVGAPSVTAEATGNQTLATPRPIARPLMQTVPAPRRASRSHTVVTWPSAATVAIVVVSGLIGAAVPILSALLSP